MKSPTKENIKQIATTKNYTTNVYIGSNDDEFISTINKSLNNAKYKIIGFESDGKKLVKNIKKGSVLKLSNFFLFFIISFYGLF